MIEYLHDYDNLGGFPEVQPFHRVSSFAFRQGDNQRPSSEDNPEYDSLAYRRKFVETVFSKGAKARAKARQEKCLNYKRITFIIYLIMNTHFFMMRYIFSGFHADCFRNILSRSQFSFPYLSNFKSQLQGIFSSLSTACLCRIIRGEC